MLPSWMRSNAIHDMDLAIKLLTSARQMAPGEADDLQTAAELVAGALGRVQHEHRVSIERSNRMLLALELGYATAVKIGDFDNVDDFLESFEHYEEDNQCTR